jgi:TetR/AcrR family transcriptional regulator, regulator of biofilm formation and stress response
VSTSEAKSDGRLARGAARRKALIDAAYTIAGRDGIGGLSHRSLARESGVAVASVSYHFGTIDDLLVAAMTQGTADWAEALAAAPEGGGAAFLAQHLAAEFGSHRPRALAEYEMYLLAARRPALRDAASAWMDVAMRPVSQGLDDVGRAVLESVIGGVFLQSLLAEEPPTAARIEAVLSRALRSAS